MDKVGLALALASPSENGEWKIHVSTPVSMPPENFDVLFNNREEEEFGRALMAELADKLGNQYPGTVVADSVRGVFAAFNIQAPKLAMLIGREWKVSPKPFAVAFHPVRWRFADLADR